MREKYKHYILQFLDKLDDEHLRKVYSFAKTMVSLQKREVSD